MNESPNSTNRNVEALIFALFIAIVYKLLSLHIKDVAGDEYYVFQYIKSIIKVFALMLSLAVYRSYGRKRMDMFSLKLDTNFFLSLFGLIILIILNYIFLGFDHFSFSTFKHELVFNLLTGLWEEILFRGVILLILTEILGAKKSILYSSILFSAFHFDVIIQWLDYVDIFFWSVGISILMNKSKNLFNLILYHFLWNQILFSIHWGNPENIVPYSISVILAEILLCFLFYKISYKNILIVKSKKI